MLRRFPHPERFETVRVVRLKTETLDDQLAANAVNDVDFLKLDTQGTELAILEGARRVIEREALGFEVEVEFLPLYRDQPVLVQVSLIHRGGIGSSAPVGHAGAVTRGLEDYVGLFVTQIRDANR